MFCNTIVYNECVAHSQSAGRLHSLPAKKGENTMFTLGQQEVLDNNDRFYVLERLPDFDLLVLDTICRPFQLPGFNHCESNAYILTRTGKIQEISYHYRYYHSEDVPAYHSRGASPSLNGDNAPYKLL